MIKEVEIKIQPRAINDLEIIKKEALKKAKLKPSANTEVVIRRRSIDARGNQPVFRLRVVIHVNESPEAAPAILDQFKNVEDNFNYFKIFV